MGSTDSDAERAAFIITSAIFRDAMGVLGSDPIDDEIKRANRFG